MQNQIDLTQKEKYKEIESSKKFVKALLANFVTSLKFQQPKCEEKLKMIIKALEFNDEEKNFISSTRTALTNNNTQFRMEKPASLKQIHKIDSKITEFFKNREQFFATQKTPRNNTSYLKH